MEYERFTAYEIQFIDLKYFIFKNIFKKFLSSFIELEGKVNLSRYEIKKIIMKMYGHFENELYFFIEDTIMSYCMKHKTLLTKKQADLLYMIFLPLIRINNFYEILIIYYTDQDDKDQFFNNLSNNSTSFNIIPTTSLMALTESNSASTPANSASTPANSTLANPTSISSLSNEPLSNKPLSNEPLSNKSLSNEPPFNKTNSSNDMMYKCDIDYLIL